MTISERFWSKVQKSDDPNGCWFWMAYRSRDGYGQFCIGSRRDGSIRMVKSHRWAFEEAVGRLVTPGLCVLHCCDVPSCVNPTHLREGTNADNVADKVAKGRQARPHGEQHGNAKLTAAKVTEIRALERHGMSQRYIAARFGINQAHVNRIAHGQSWAHIPQ